MKQYFVKFSFTFFADASSSLIDSDIFCTDDLLVFSIDDIIQLVTSKMEEKHSRLITLKDGHFIGIHNVKILALNPL